MGKTPSTLKILKINVRNFTFSDGSLLSGDLTDPFSISVSPPGSKEFQTLTYRHFHAIVFPRPATVLMTFRVQSGPAVKHVTKAVRFSGKTTNVRQFLERMIAFTRELATASECQQIMGSPKRHTYGWLMGDHVFFETMTKDARGRYNIGFGS